MKQLIPFCLLIYIINTEATTAQVTAASDMLPHSLFVQANKSGLYKTATDYVKGELSFEVDCKTEKHKIKLHNFNNKPFIDIIHNNQKYTFLKSELFGFRDCEGKDWRFFENKEYQLMENGPLAIYKKIEIVSEPNKKGLHEKVVYFFSTGITEKLLLLTILNLKRATPQNHIFHDKLDGQFRSDEELAMYDSFHQKFKVNHLLLQSKQ